MANGASLRDLFDQEGVQKPNFFIVGAPKSATTAMAVSLAQHPDIFMSTPKEPHAFGEDLSRLRQRMAPKDYVDLFRGVPAPIRGEASVWYLRSKVAVDEIHEFCPTARILVMLRSPVDMLRSLHAQSIRSGIEHIRDFEEALEAELDRREGKRIRSGVRYTDQLLYSEAVAYGPQVERYLDRFGREAVKVILFDDVLEDPARVMQETQEFLGVTPLGNVQLIRANEAVRVRSAYVQRVLRNPRKLRSVSRLLMPRRARARIAAIVAPRIERVNLTSSQEQAMTAALRAELTDRFRPGVERLAVLIDRDLEKWLNVETPQGHRSNS